MVKKEEKKGFVIPIVRNGIKICQKLKLPHEKQHGKLVRVASKDNKIPENITKEIINLGAEEKFEKHIICSNDLASCDGLIVEDVEEYPVCCVNSFNENKWNDLTIAMDYVDENMKEIQGDIEIVEEIIENKYDIANQYIEICNNKGINYFNPKVPGHRANLYKFILFDNQNFDFSKIKTKTSPVYDYSLGDDPEEIVSRHICLPIWYKLEQEVFSKVKNELENL